jgi:ribose transport system ATP-binding protein
MKHPDIILETSGICKRFPGVYALRDVCFNLCRGEIHGLVGHNGAGKSTLVKVITGAYIPDSGTIFLDGEKVVFRHPKDAIDKKIGIVTQEGTLINSFNGIENIFLGKERSRFGVVDNKLLKQKGLELMQSLNIDINLTVSVNELSPANRKLIEIMKIINQEPNIVIFDESTASLSDRERQQLFQLMYQFRDKGMGVIFITHYLDEVLQVSDRITVMRDGSIVGTVDAKSATKHEIIKMMINKEQKSEFIDYDRKIGEVLLDAENLNDGKVVNDVSLCVHSGEVVGLFGTVGSGRTETLETLFGARSKKSGSVMINGKKVNIKNTKQAIEAGMALIPEDRLKKALMLGESVAENITLPFLKDYTKASVINRKKQIGDVKRTVDKLDIRTPSIYTKVNSLSGGNKQKVSFGKWITSNSKKTQVYLFDEPTEGVDIGACAEMYGIIAEIVQNGAGCLIVSSDISEIIGLSDRIYVMKDGKIVSQFSRGDLDLHQKLIASSLGINEGVAEYGQ